MEVDDLLRRDGQVWRGECGFDSDDSVISARVGMLADYVGRSAPAGRRQVGIGVGSPDLPVIATVAAQPRRSRTLLLAAAAVIIVVLCTGIALALSGSNGSGAGGGGRPGSLPTAPVSTDPRTPDTAPQGIRTRRVKILPRVHGPNLLSMPWELLSTRRNGRVLIIYYVGGDSVGIYGVHPLGFQVIETPVSVELIAVSKNANPDDTQGGSLELGITRITLRQPLGGRALLHAPTDWSASTLLH